MIVISLTLTFLLLIYPNINFFFFFFQRNVPAEKQKSERCAVLPSFHTTDISLCFVGIMPSLTISCYLKGVSKTAASLL